MLADHEILYFRDILSHPSYKIICQVIIVARQTTHPTGLNPAQERQRWEDLTKFINKKFDGQDLDPTSVRAEGARLFRTRATEHMKYINMDRDGLKKMKDSFGLK